MEQITIQELLNRYKERNAQLTENLMIDELLLEKYQAIEIQYEQLLKEFEEYKKSKEGKKNDK